MVFIVFAPKRAILRLLGHWRRRCFDFLSVFIDRTALPRENGISGVIQVRFGIIPGGPEGSTG